jgi:hypothetical protein
MPTRSLLPLAVALTLGAFPACSTPKPEPQFASSANHAHYARDYPAELNAVTKDFGERRAEARKIQGEFNGYPAKIKDPPSWAHVLEIVDRAGEDGRSYAYVERLRRVQAAAAFFDAEKDEINKKVAGSVAYTAKKKGCDEAIAGAAAPALKDAVDELGKDNAAALEKQADDISRASYLVHVEIVEDKLRILRMVAEADDIRKTADDAIGAERAYQASNKKLTDADKKASEARIADMNKSKASVDAAVQQAQGVMPSLEDEIKKIQKEYDDALDALDAKIKEKIH